MSQYFNHNRILFTLRNCTLLSTKWAHFKFDTFTFIYIYAFSRRFYPKWLTVHSGYTFVLSVWYLLQVSKKSGILPETAVGKYNLCAICRCLLKLYHSKKKAICEHGPEAPLCPVGQGSFKIEPLRTLWLSLIFNFSFNSNEGNFNAGFL